MHQFLVTCSPLVIDSAAWTFGSCVSNSLLHYAIPQLNQDWSETPSNAPNTYRKFFFLTAQISLIGGCLAVYLAAPAVFLSFFACYPSAPLIHAIALNCFQGFLVQSTIKLGDYFIKQANENHTPDQEIRKKSIWILNLSTRTILVLGIFLQVHYTNILFTQIVIDRTAQHLYDFNPEKGDQVTIRLTNTCVVRGVEFLSHHTNKIQQGIVSHAHQWSNAIMRSLGIN